MRTVRTALLVPVVFVVILLAPVWADDITDWNRTLFRAGLVAVTPPNVMTRVAAVVQVAVFDAVNGIDRRYTPIHVTPAGPAGASRNAAAVEAASTTLVQLYPPQKATFDARLAISLAAIGEHESSSSIAGGLLWGQTVANAILAWRSTDGFSIVLPPLVGGTAVGQWRPTPPAFAPGATPQLADVTPWVINSPSQFRPAGPPALTSARYAADFNETKTMGGASSVTRTPDPTVLCLVLGQWHDWNQVAAALAERGLEESDEDFRRQGHPGHHASTLENARLLALLNLAIADAAIGCWDAKYTYVAWRPVTAIPLADTDGNPATTADPT